MEELEELEELEEWRSGGVGGVEEIPADGRVPEGPNADPGANEQPDQQNDLKKFREILVAAEQILDFGLEFRNLSWDFVLVPEFRH